MPRHQTPAERRREAAERAEVARNLLPAGSLAQQLPQQHQQQQQNASSGGSNAFASSSGSGEGVREDGGEGFGASGGAQERQQTEFGGFDEDFFQPETTGTTFARDPSPGSTEGSSSPSLSDFGSRRRQRSASLATSASSSPSSHPAKHQSHATTDSLPTPTVLSSSLPCFLGSAVNEETYRRMHHKTHPPATQIPIPLNLSRSQAWSKPVLPPPPTDKFGRILASTPQTTFIVDLSYEEYKEQSEKPVNGLRRISFEDSLHIDGDARVLIKSRDGSTRSLLSHLRQVFRLSTNSDEEGSKMEDEEEKAIFDYLQDIVAKPAKASDVRHDKEDTAGGVVHHAWWLPLLHKLLDELVLSPDAKRRRV